MTDAGDQAAFCQARSGAAGRPCRKAPGRQLRPALAHGARGLSQKHRRGAARQRREIPRAAVPGRAHRRARAARGARSRYGEVAESVRRLGPGVPRSRPQCRTPGHAAVGQRHRPCAGPARRHGDRRAGGADLAGLFADVAGSRQAQIHLRAVEAGPGLRGRRHEVPGGAQGARPGRRRPARRDGRGQRLPAAHGQDRRSWATCWRRRRARRSSAPSPRSGPTPSPRSCSPRARPACRRASSTPSAC